MNDIIGKIVLAVGDEDLLALDAVSAVLRPFRAGAYRRKIGACLRLGQVHGGGPLARDQLLEVLRPQFIRPMRNQRFDGSHREHRPDAERHGG